MDWLNVLLRPTDILLVLGKLITMIRLLCALIMWLCAIILWVESVCHSLCGCAPSICQTQVSHGTVWYRSSSQQTDWIYYFSQPVLNKLIMLVIVLCSLTVWLCWCTIYFSDAGKSYCMYHIGWAADKYIEYIILLQQEWKLESLI